MLRYAEMIWRARPVRMSEDEGTAPTVEVAPIVGAFEAWLKEQDWKLSLAVASLASMPWGGRLLLLQ